MSEEEKFWAELFKDHGVTKQKLRDEGIKIEAVDTKMRIGKFIFIDPEIQFRKD